MNWPTVEGVIVEAHMLADGSNWAKVRVNGADITVDFDDAESLAKAVKAGAVTLTVRPKRG